MAYVKIKPIHASLEKALNYIADSDKTAEGRLISSYSCSTIPEIAKKEFNIVSSNTATKKRKDSVIARHLIQSFSPEDNVTPEKANKIGQKLAEEVLKNEYQYIVATHVDQDHIHNHIIFNTTNMNTSTKYRSNKYTYQRIQKCSDNLCKEHNLSIIPPKLETQKGKSYKEYIESKTGNSWKDSMKIDIDITISKVKSYSDFIKEMEKQNYTIKQGKYTSFKHPNQERFTRGKTLGEKYSEESIRYRIENPNTVELNKMIEMNERNKAKGVGFKKFAAKKNIEELSRMTQFMSENSINSLADYNKLYRNNLLKINELENKINDINSKIDEHSSTINSIITWKKTKEIYDKYLKLEGNEKNKYALENQDIIKLHQDSSKILKDKFKGSKIPKVSSVRNELSQLELDLKQAKIELYAHIQHSNNLVSFKSNIQSLYTISNSNISRN